MKNKILYWVSAVWLIVVSISSTKSVLSIFSIFFHPKDLIGFNSIAAFGILAMITYYCFGLFLSIYILQAMIRSRKFQTRILYLWVFRIIAGLVLLFWVTPQLPFIVLFSPIIILPLIVDVVVAYFIYLSIHNNNLIGSIT